MGITVEQLLAGPRGRRACLAFAMLGDQEADLAAAIADPGGESTPSAFSSALWDYTLAIDSRSGGTGFAVFATATAPVEDALADDEYVSPAEARRLEQALRQELLAKEPPSPRELNELLLQVPLLPVTETTLLTALGRSVDSARYWQEPDAEDQLCSEPELLSGLRRAAQHLADSPLTVWWDRSHDPAAQWVVGVTDQPLPRMRGTAGVLRADTAEKRAMQAKASTRRQPKDPAKQGGGEWWTLPGFGTTSSSGSHGGAPLQLWLEEDGLGAERMAVTQLSARPSDRIYEVASADDWAELCANYPLDVSARFRSLWFLSTGRDGAWVLPDLEALSAHWDGLHLSLAAYLALAGTVIEVPGHGASLLAGWHPESTFWLTDPPPVQGPIKLWLRDHEGGWAEAGPLPDDDGETSAL